MFHIACIISVNVYVCKVFYICTYICRCFDSGTDTKSILLKITFTIRLNTCKTKLINKILASYQTFIGFATK